MLAMFSKKRIVFSILKRYTDQYWMYGILLKEPILIVKVIANIHTYLFDFTYPIFNLTLI